MEKVFLVSPKFVLEFTKLKECRERNFYSS